MINTHKNIVWWNNAFFCATLYGATTDSILCFNFRHLSMQWYISPNNWLDHLPSGGLFIHVRIFKFQFTAAQGPPPLTNWHEGQELPGYQPHPNVQILPLEHNRLMQGCSIFHPVGQTSLIPSGKSLSH